MGECFVKSVVRGEEQRQAEVTQNALFSEKAGRDVSLTNVELCSGAGLRSHRPIVSEGYGKLPENILAVRAYRDCMILLSQEQSNGFYEIYSFKNGTIGKICTSVKAYPFSSDGSDYCSSMVVTEDDDGGIHEGCNHTKLVFFPSKQVLCLDSYGLPSFVTTAGDDVPAFSHATVAKGRLYGSVGQKLYVSGELGCFDWYFEEGETAVSSPSAAWWGNSMTVSEGGLPITALVSYKDGVLVFRENAMQMIKGDVTPFIVRDLFKTGTSDGRSVKEADGKLYFISENRVVCYNGSGLTFLPSLPKGTVLPGPAGVFEGKYCFYALRNNRHLIYTYHPELNRYSVVRFAQRIRDFITCGRKLYLLTGEKGEKNPLYCFSEDRSGAPMEVDISLTCEDYADFSIDEVDVHANLGSYCSGDLTVEMTDRDGGVTTHQMGTFYGEKDTERLFSIKKRLSKGCKAKIKIRSIGDLLIKGYRVVYRKKTGGQRDNR